MVVAIGLPRPTVRWVSGSYQFAEDGKMINPEIKDTSKDGIVQEDGSLYYYRDGVRYYAGLIEIDGSYYYVETSGEVVHGRNTGSPRPTD